MRSWLSLTVLVLLAVPAAADEGRPTRATVGLTMQGATEEARAVIARRLLLLDREGAAPVSGVSWDEDTVLVSLSPTPCRGRVLACIAEVVTRGPEVPCTPERLAAWEATLRDTVTRSGVIVLSRAERSAQRPLRDALEEHLGIDGVAYFLDDRAGVEVEGAGPSAVEAAVAAVNAGSALGGLRVVWHWRSDPPHARAVLYAVARQGVTIDGVRSARTRADGDWEAQTLMELEPDDAEAFGALTKASVQEILTIEVDGRLVSAPVVMEPITGGQVSIIGCSPGGSREACVERAGTLAAVMEGGVLRGAVAVDRVESRCFEAR
ncbi:MAG: hypothetical protein AMXMBFR64_00020 [Myxococcales bacterium]